VVQNARIWLALNRHWFVIGLVLAVALLALLEPNDVGGVGWWIAIALGGLVVFLLAVYVLTRFVLWASRQK
jgi:Flp pilus assembly protein protease CpaA